MSDRLDEEMAAFDRMLEPEEAASEETPADQPEETPEPQAEAPEEEAPQVEEAPQEPEVDPELDAYLQKYGGDADKALRAAVEQSKLLGRQGQELGELRKLVEERLPEKQEPEQPAVQVNQQVVDWFDEQLERNPSAAVQWARDNDPSGALVNRGMEYWYEDQPVAAMQYIMDERLKKQEADLRAEFQQSTAPLQSMAQRNMLTETWETVSEKLPDLNERSEAITEAVKFAPEVAQGLQSHDAAEREAALTKLYYIGAGISGASAGPPAQEETAAAAAQIQQAARDAKLSGTVASQTRTGEAEQVDPGEQWLEDMGFNRALERHESSGF